MKMTQTLRNFIYHCGGGLCTIRIGGGTMRHALTRHALATVSCLLVLAGAFVLAADKSGGPEKPGSPDKSPQPGFRQADGAAKDPVKSKPAKEAEKEGASDKGTESPAAPAAARTYVDEDYGFHVQAPVDWPRADPASFSVEAYGGEICRVWSPDGVASIIVFVQHTTRSYAPRELVEAYAVTESLHVAAEVQQKELPTVAGLPATSLVLLGNGTGSAIDGASDVPTSVHWVAIPKKDHILNFLLTCREIDFETADQAFKAMLDSLAWQGDKATETGGDEPAEQTARPPRKT